MITLGVLAFVGIVAVVVAKLVQFCMKSHYSDNDENEIDENTRDLIRARLSVIQFKKREIKKARKDKTLSVFKKWREIAKNKKKDRDEALKAQRPEESGDVVITIDKIDALKIKGNGIIENGDSKISENGSPRRFPFFSKNKTPGGSVKSHMDSLRVTSTNKVTGQQELAVPRGRPVSSKLRASPNVTLTDVDINNTAKIPLKSTHVDDENELNKVSTDSERKVKINSVAPTDKDPILKADNNNVKGNIEKETEESKNDEKS